MEKRNLVHVHALHGAFLPCLLFHAACCPLLIRFWEQAQQSGHARGFCVCVCAQRRFQGLLDSVPRHCRGKPAEIQPGCHGAGDPQSFHHQHTTGGQGKQPAFGDRAWGVLGVKKGELGALLWWTGKQRINLLPAKSQASSSSLCVPSWSYPEGFGGASAPWNSLLLCCPPLKSNCSGSSELGAGGNRRKRED